jgi:hypothetical protein
MNLDYILPFDIPVQIGKEYFIDPNAEAWDWKGYWGFGGNPMVIDTTQAGEARFDSFISLRVESLSLNVPEATTMLLLGLGLIGLAGLRRKFR